MTNYTLRTLNLKEPLTTLELNLISNRVNELCLIVDECLDTDSDLLESCENELTVLNNYLKYSIEITKKFEKIQKIGLKVA